VDYALSSELLGRCGGHSAAKFLYVLWPATHRPLQCCNIPSPQNRHTSNGGCHGHATYLGITVLCLFAVFHCAYRAIGLCRFALTNPWPCRRPFPYPLRLRETLRTQWVHLLRAGLNLRGNPSWTLPSPQSCLGADGPVLSPSSFRQRQASHSRQDRSPLHLTRHPSFPSDLRAVGAEPFPVTPELGHALQEIPAILTSVHSITSPFSSTRPAPGRPTPKRRRQAFTL